MATHGKIKEFDPSHETWTTFIEHLEFYFITNGIDDPVKKQAVLLTVNGCLYSLDWTTGLTFMFATKNQFYAL